MYDEDQNISLTCNNGAGFVAKLTSKFPLAFFSTPWVRYTRGGIIHVKYKYTA